MKNRLLPILAFFLLLLITAKSYSTNVTGGIYSNTTWTAANSPYIVGDSVVVFEGVTLTIEPGVIVEFNNGTSITNRGTIYAEGTATDTIIFTSSSPTPYPGIYQYALSGNFSFEYCRFLYAGLAVGINYYNYPIPVAHCVFISNQTAINYGNDFYNSTIDSCSFINNNYCVTGGSPLAVLTTQNCVFTCNVNGITGGGGPVLNCTFSYNNSAVGGVGNIENCSFFYNNTALRMGERCHTENSIFEYNVNAINAEVYDTVSNNTIKYNYLGIWSDGIYLFYNDISDNNIGIESSGDYAYMCNSICNNTVYNYVNETSFDISAANNYWCLTDSASIQATILDGYENVNLGLVFVSPFETSPCSNVGSTLSAIPPVIITDTLKVNTPAPICSGESTILKTSGASSYSWSPSTGLGAASGDSITVHPTVTTTYTVSGTATTCYGDQLSASVAVIVNPTPTITAAPNAVSICPGESSTLTASGGGSYTWSPSTALSATTGSSVTANPTVTTTYTVTGTGSDGCSATNTVVVTVNTKPIINASSNPVAYCAGGSAILTASGGITYKWSPATALSATTGSSVTANPTTTTTYTVIDSSSCGKDTTTVVVTVTTTLPVTVNTPPTICSGNSVTLSATGAATYSWSPATGLSATIGNSVTAAPTVTTTYTVIGAIGTGCTGTDNVTVSVNPTPTITVTADPVSYCLGGSSTLTASGGDTYTWSPATDLNTTIGAIVNADPTVTTAYTVTGTGSDGCPATATVTVSVNPTPAITATAYPASYCPGGNSTLIALGGDTYIWSPATGLNTTTGEVVYANPTVTTTYTVVGTNSGGCPGISNVVVTVYPTPTITATPNPASYCSGQSSTLTASGGTIYTWSPATDLSATTGTTVTANPTITSTYAVTGINSTGCSATDTVTITVSPSPTITVSPNPSYCRGGSATLDAYGGLTFTWSPATALSVTTGATVEANPTITTIYTVTGTDAIGCSATDTTIVTVNPNPVVTVYASPTSICAGGVSTLIATGGNTYTWTPSTGLSATTGAIVAADPTVTTTYVVIGTNSSGCQGTETIILTVNAATSIDVTPTPALYCSGGSSVLTATGADTYTWSPTTDLSATTGATVTANPTETATYTVTGTTANGCSATNTVTVMVNPSPVITASPNPSYCSGGSVALNAYGGNAYTWSPATGLSATTGATVTADPSLTATYVVSGTNSSGCSATDTVIVTVSPDPAITALASPGSYCAGGISALSATGGDTYVWTPSTGLSATTGAIVAANPIVTTAYVVIGTNSSGCQGSYTVVVSVGTSATVTASALPSSFCENGSATLTAMGCNTYMWAPATGLSDTTGSTVIASPMVTTTYTVNGSSGVGCTGTTTVTVTVNPNPTITVTSPVVCTGDSATLTATGADTYTWTPATGLSATTGSSVVASPSVTTTYIVTGTGAFDCTAEDTATVTVVKSPNQPSFHQHGDTLISTSVHDNQWYLNGTPLTGDTSQDLVITSVGEYWVIVNNEANGCSTASDSMDINTVTGVNQLTVESGQLTVYPNPFSNNIFIKINLSAVDVGGWNLLVTDVLGRTLFLMPSLNYSNEIDLSNLSNGMYFITVINKMGRVVVPVVKQN